MTSFLRRLQGENREDMGPEEGQEWGGKGLPGPREKPGPLCLGVGGRTVLILGVTSPDWEHLLLLSRD